MRENKPKTDLGIFEELLRLLCEGAAIGDSSSQVMGITQAIDGFAKDLVMICKLRRSILI